MIPLPKFTFNGLATAFNLFKNSIPEGQREEVFKAAFIDWLSSKDEVAFMWVKGLIDPEDSETLDAWFREETEDNIGYLFRKFVTTHPKDDARVDILLSYAAMNSHPERTARFKAESVPPEFITAIKKFFKSENRVKAYKFLCELERDLDDFAGKTKRERDAHLDKGKDKKGFLSSIHKIVNKLWY